MKHDFYINSQQREHFSSKLMDSANVILATLVIGGIIDSKIGGLKSTIGIFLYIMILLITTAILKGDKHARK